MSASGVMAGCLCAVLLASCSEWRYRIALHDVAFAQVKTDERGFAIGMIDTDAVVAGRACQRGWLHLHPNGTPAAFTAAEPFDLGRSVVPAGTWVFQDDLGTVTVCAFPRDLEMQGHLCGGSGGPKGTQTAFYRSGALREFFPPRDTRIDGVLCRAGPFSGWIELHENGRLKSGQLAEPMERDGQHRPAGARVNFTADGRLVP